MLICTTEALMTSIDFHPMMIDVESWTLANMTCHLNTYG